MAAEGEIDRDLATGKYFKKKIIESPLTQGNMKTNKK
jgi:hypothetical protein